MTIERGGRINTDITLLKIASNRILLMLLYLYGNHYKSNTSSAVGRESVTSLEKEKFK